VEARYKVRDLLRGDAAARATYYQIMRNIEAMSVNEVRDDEDMPGIGPEGDKYEAPTQLQAVGAAAGDDNAREPAMLRTTDLAFEIREISLDAADVELRAATDRRGSPVFYGHAAVFNTRTAIGNPLTWGFYEEIASGAFTKTLQEGDARFLVDHNTQLLVSRVSAGDLRPRRRTRSASSSTPTSTRSCPTSGT
jgi:hypothetical protein